MLIPTPSFPWTEGEHYSVNSDTGCWEWAGPRTGDGHGIAGHDGRTHRLAYEAVRGEIPKGSDVHHECENPPCVNPAHLELLTHSEHSIRHARAKSALTEADVVAMRTAVYNGERIVAVAARYGITATTCGLICQGKRWKNVGGPIGVAPKVCAECGVLLPLESSRNPRRRKFCTKACGNRAAERKRAKS